MSGWIYFIACTETFRVKIGYTAGDPIQRMKALQTGSPTPLTFMAVQPGTQAEEREMHERFAAHRLHGEWFSPHPDIIKHLAVVCMAFEADALENGEEVQPWVQVGLDTLRSFDLIPPTVGTVQ